MRMAKGESGQVKRGFDDLARAYAASEPPKRNREIERFVQWISPREADYALDVASGPATVARVLAASVKRVVALDISHSMLQEACRFESLPAGLFRTAGDALHLPFRNATFDLLTCTYAFANIHAVAIMLSEAARVVTPAGRIAFMDVVAPEDPSQCGQLNRLEAMRSEFYTRIRTTSECVDLFRDSGLTLIRSERQRATQRMTDWLRLSPAAADPERARQLRQALLDSIEGDKAGLDPRREGDEVEFQYHAAWFLLRRLDG
jgi:ubiquinone/menaquinone biosynthesis C-methylase UbiE